MSNQTNNYKLTTPHACVMIWNYDDRLGLDPTTDATVNTINQVILDTVSCVAIHTSKGKGSAAGSFSFELAPWRDWVAEITAGSWCTILMSNQPITQTQLRNADKNFVKMIGKIESVRVDVNVDEEGARHSRYIVTGTDWGHIFNNVLYVDNLIAAASDPTNQGNTIAIALQKMLFGDGNTPQSFKVADNLVALLGIFGASSPGLDAASNAVNRIDKSIYDFLIPTKMAQYFNFVDGDNNQNQSTKLSDLLTLQTGKLTSYDTYADTNEAYGFIDPFSIQGTNTFWQILMDNSNPALNELYNEIEWDQNNQGTIGPSLTIYNRIKPFSYQDESDLSESAASLRSPFTLLKTHTIDNIKVMNINVGTNWRDKYNFVEIRPLFQDFEILAGWTAQKAQGSDTVAFNREGFRPFIVGTKQFPVLPSGSEGTYDASLLTSWVILLKEWYFSTHKLLNGTLVMTGATEYIGVGNNILFEAGLINPTMNLNADANTNTNTNYILAHVENVEHSFTVTQEGARTYTTTIQFVRGIVVNKSNHNYTLVGDGSLDELSSTLQTIKFKNTTNTVTTSDGISDNTHPIDPDPRKVWDLTMDGTVRDSSIWTDPDSMAVMNRLDGLIRIGIVKGAFNDANTGELRYLVEIQSNAKKINMNCRMMRRSGGVYNYEDYINRGYKTNDSPDPVTGFDAKAGDAVLVGQLNGQGREGIILGGLTHAARTTAIQATDGPQYDAEFNGVHTNINADGEWTLTFKGQPTNLDDLDNTPSGALPDPVYDTTVGSSFMQFDMTGSWTISDNATSDPQSLFIDKPNGMITLTSGQVSLVLNKSDQSVTWTSQDFTLNSTNTITSMTAEYQLTASSSAKFDSPQIAIGHGSIELLDQLSQLVDALGSLTAISPVGPCAPLMAAPSWSMVTQIQQKINQIKGTLS